MLEIFEQRTLIDWQNRDNLYYDVLLTRRAVVFNVFFPIVDWQTGMSPTSAGSIRNIFLPVVRRSFPDGDNDL